MVSPVTTPPPPPASGAGGGVLALTAVTALAPASWGATYLITTELLPPDHPMFAGLVRALPAGLAALALTRTLPRGIWWWRAAVLGGLNIGLFFPLLFVAAERLPGGVAATFGAAQPLVVAVLATVLLGERPTVRRFAWGLLGVAGVALVVLGPAAALSAAGVAAGLAGAVSMAAGVTLTKRWSRPDAVGPLAFAGWQLTAGGLVLLPLTVLAEGMPPAVDAAAAGGYLWFATVGGLGAYALWFRGIGLLPVTSVAMLALVSPLVAAVLGAVVLGQLLGPLQLVGFLLALAAIVGGSLPSGGTGSGPGYQRRRSRSRTERPSGS